MSDEMCIEQITLNNYRQYYGKTVIRFTTRKNVFSIIVGANGAGKSNLWNAIHWCLFNEEPHLKSTDKPPIINKKYLHERMGKFLTTYVEIIMKKSKDKYLIKRSLSGTLEHLEKDDNGMIKLSKEDPVPVGFFIQDSDKSELFQISKNGGPWQTQSRNFKNLIHEHIVPKNLARFFILDGEFLQDLFNEFENIKSGIDQISQINVLNKTIEATHNVKFQKPKGTGVISEIIENIERHERELASENNLGSKLYSETQTIYGTEDPMHAMGTPRKSDLERSIKNLDEELRSLTSKIDDSGASLKLEIIKNHTRTSERKKIAESELKTNIQNHIKNLLINGPLIMCKSSLESASMLIKAEMDKGKLPNSHKRMMLEALLEKNMCLCGTPLSDGTNVRKHVEHEMERMGEQAQYDIAADMSIISKNFLTNYDNILLQLNDEWKDIEEKKRQLGSIKEELQDLTRRLPESDVDYADMINQKNKLDGIRDEYQRELGSVDAAVGRLNREKADEIRKLQVAEGRTREIKEATLLIQKDSLVQTTLDKIRQNVGETIREKVAQKTLEVYNNMSWKNDYEHLQIDDRYQISIRGKDGMDIVGGMAAGEKLFLALSFIMALKNITNYQFPFVIDSPLGKAGGNLKISFGKYMPELLNGSQMIMLATNTEYGKDKIRPETGDPATHTLKELLEKNGHVREYKIDFDRANETANIIAGKVL